MRHRLLRIGTRGSDLALWQARHVADRIAAMPGAPPCELVVVATSGDLLADVPLSQVGGRAFFTREIEESLSAGEIDLAVHSLKDLPTSVPAGLAIGAVLAREDPRDVLIAAAGARHDLDSLPRSARVGTSSPRRQALLARWRGDLEPVDLRGNVPTRIQKLDGGRFDAIVLAAAGVHRLGLAGRISSYLPLDRFLPAPGQGAIAVQVRGDDAATRRWAALLDDPATEAATTAERTLLGRLEAGCQAPLAAFGEVRDGRLALAAIVCSLDGRMAIEGRGEGSAVEAVSIGEALAEELLSRGAGELLAAIRAR